MAEGKYIGLTRQKLLPGEYERLPPSAQRALDRQEYREAINANHLSIAELIECEFMPEPGCARVVGLGHSSCHKCGYYTDGSPRVGLCPLEFMQDPIRGGRIT